MTGFRTILGVLSVAACLASAASASATAPESPNHGRLAFDVALDGKPIGQHRLEFESRSDGELAVRIAIDLEVKFGPFTVFDYVHRNETLWRDGLLKQMQSETIDDGDRHTVKASGDGEKIQVTVDSGVPYQAGRGTLPTTYWMASTVAQNQLINSQTGELLEVTVTEVGEEEVPSPDGPIMATRYHMEGDLEIDLWYDTAGILVGLAFEARGSDVTYRLVERINPLPIAQAMPHLTARNLAAR